MAVLLGGEIWPDFARQNRREALVTSLLKNRRQALREWRDEAEQITAQLGVLASLHLVAGNNQTLAGAAFGFPAASGHAVPIPCKRMAALSLFPFNAYNCRHSRSTV